MAIKTSDLLEIGDRPQRLTAAEAIAGLEKVLGPDNVWDKDRELAHELEAAAIEGGLDFAILWYHVMNETDWLRAPYWNNRTNPAGIAITGEPGKDGPVFKTVKAAARFYVALVKLKIEDGNLAELGSFTGDRSTAPDVFDGTREFTKDPTFPRVVTLDDLRKRFGPNNRECVWMCDQEGPLAIIAKGKEGSPNLPDQRATVPVDPTPPPVRPVGIPVKKWMVPKGRRNRPGTKMTAGDLWFVVHETGNENWGADAESQAAWIVENPLTNNPNGPSYHGAVDGGIEGSSKVTGEFYQCLPFDEIGLHAADGCNSVATDYGCFRGLAIEGSVNADGDEGRMRRNYAEIIARIAAGDPAFDWGDGSTRGRFSVDRIAQHYQVSDDGPDKHDCPQHMRNERGAWAAFVAECKRQFVIWDKAINGAPVPVFPAKRVPIAKAGKLRLGDMIVDVKANKDRRFHVTHGGRSRTAPDRDAPISRPSSWLRSPTKVVTFPWEAIVDGEKWHGSNAGNWVPGKMLEPA